jgi:hypothetical protein
MVRPTFTFTNTPFPIDVIRLGTLVPDKRHPNRDSIRNDEVTEEDYSTAPDRNFDAYLNTGSDSNFHAMVSKIFTFGLFKKSHETLQYASGKALLYELHHPRDIFRDLCALDDTRRTLEEWSEEGQEAYFIIAYRTLTDATLVDESSRSRGGDANIQVPVAALAGVDAAVGGASDVGATAAHEGTEERGEHFLCEGERVYAVCCRKVKLKMVDGFVDDARLASKDVWVSYYPTRSAREGVSLAQAVLTEEADEEDLSDRKDICEHPEGDIFETLYSDGEEEEDD